MKNGNLTILLLTPCLPGLSSGAAQRTELVLKSLQVLGDVKLLLVHEGRTLYCVRTPHPGVLAEIGYPEPAAICKYRRATAAQSLVRSAVDLENFDIVVCRYVGLLAALPAFDGPIIVDADDAYYRYPTGLGWHLRAFATAKSWLRIARGRKVLREADHVWFCSERDQAEFRVRSSSILPNAVAPSNITAESAADSETVVLIVGAMWYRPNRDAVEWFVRNCWPGIRRCTPDARFRIVGEVSSECARHWSRSAGVESVGYVDDLISEYRRARLTVVPILAGGGTQIKAIESLSHGRVPVVSSFVAAGYSPYLKHAESLYVADSPAQYIETITHVLRNPLWSVSVASRGQNIVRERFSHARFVEAASTSLSSITHAISRERGSRSTSESR